MSQEMTQHHFSPETHQQKIIQIPSDHLSKSGSDETSQFEKDKELIKSHPLFVLLELLFEKCESATKGEETPSSAAYDRDIQEFVRKHETSLNPIFIDDNEIDNLMVKAIQVLRIHLLELEKVNELCKDFCKRYITCLKGKMHSENLLRSDMGPYNDNNAQQLMHGNNSQHIASTPNSNISVNQQGEFVRHGGHYQAPTRDESMIHNENSIDGSTPLSQVAAAPAHQSHFPPPQQLYLHNPHMQGAPDDGHSKKTAKRGVLPKQATETLRSWLFSHIVHPYPTEDEKRTLATQTNLTLLQVNNWFINARRRILQPMLDASNHEVGGSSSKTKKSKMQASRPTERFWPNNIASSGGGMSHQEEEDAGAASNQIPSSVLQHSITNARPPHMSIEGYRDQSPVDLEQQQTSQLHHYHSDVTVTSRSQATLNMVKN